MDMCTRMYNNYDMHNYYNIYCRYTSRPSDGSVYAIALSWPESYVFSIGSVTPVTSSFTIDLLGYGPVNYNLNTTGLYLLLPPMSLDSELKWAWTFKFNGVRPTGGQDGRQAPVKMNVM